MEPDPDNPFIKYLLAKKSVDDRSLNGGVWQALAQALPGCSTGSPLQVLEVGAGIGIMFRRILERDLLTYAQYTLVDSDPALVAYGRERLAGWAQENGYAAVVQAGEARVRKPGREMAASYQNAEALSFVRRAQGNMQWDLIVAHAFLDLLNLPEAVPALLSALKKPGLLYATINFDGLTILEPAIDPPFDDQVMAQYHRTMDERLTDGRPSGDSRTGRHLFGLLRRLGVQILAAGASDWVVFPGPQGYPPLEADFLHFIVRTIHGALRGCPELDPLRFAGWVQERHAQIERCELVYIAHQMDILGMIS